MTDRTRILRARCYNYWTTEGHNDLGVSPGISAWCWAGMGSVGGPTCDQHNFLSLRRLWKISYARKRSLGVGGLDHLLTTI